MPDVRIQPYVALMKKAINGDISLGEFASSYIALFQAEKAEYEEGVFDVLNDVFLDADEYTPSTDSLYNSLKAQSPSFLIGDDEFMRRIKEAVRKLV